MADSSTRPGHVMFVRRLNNLAGTPSNALI